MKLVDMTGSAGALTSGAIIETSRNRQGLTQDDLAHLADVSRSTVQKIERNDPSISRKSLRKVIEALGLDMSAVDAGTVAPAGRPLADVPDEVLIAELARRTGAPVEEVRRQVEAARRLREFTAKEEAQADDRQ